MKPRVRFRYLWLAIFAGLQFCLTERPAAAAAVPVTVTPDAAFQAMFDAYGNNNTLLDDWTGSDGVLSVLLPDGRVLWDFSDTFLGLVNSNGSRPGGQPFINNSLIIQNGDALAQTLHGGSVSLPTSFFLPGDDSWYWVGDMSVEGDQLRVFLTQFTRTGSGGFDFQWIGNAFASLSLPDLVLQSIIPTYAQGNVMYGASLLEDGSYTYIYGSEDVAGTEKYLHVARAPAGNLLGAWEFFNGTSWSSDPNSTARLLEGIGNGFSVVKSGKQYLLFTMDSLVAFSDEMVFYRATNPAGPFGSRTHLYNTPESQQGLFTYDAHVHPEFNNSDGMLVSYDVNAFNFRRVLGDVESYRPRFLRIKIGR